MSKSTRDLLLLSSQHAHSMEQEVEVLHQILFQAERLDNFVTAHELIDLYKYQITRNSVQIKRIIRNKKEDSFIFISNLN